MFRGVTGPLWWKTKSTPTYQMIVPDFQVCAYWNLNNLISLLENSVLPSGWPKPPRCASSVAAEEQTPSKAFHTTSSRRKLPFGCSDWRCFSLLQPGNQKATGKGGSPSHSTSPPFHSKATSEAVSATWEQLSDHSHTCDRAGITERRGGVKKKLTDSIHISNLIFKRKSAYLVYATKV